MPVCGGMFDMGGLGDALVGEEAQLFLDELNGESERACSLVGAARLDDLLREVINAYLIETKTAYNELLNPKDPNAAFREFSTKIAVA